MLKSLVASLALGVFCVGMVGCKGSEKVSDVPAPKDTTPITAPQDNTLYTPPTDIATGPTTAGPTIANANTGASVPTVVIGGTGAPLTLAGDGGTYTIQRGDTLWSIATRYYGSGKRWRDIVSANPGLVPESMAVGQAIRLP